MNWFYAKDGQQIGPVEFSEIERLHSEGKLAEDALVWQQGTANWVKLSTVLKTQGGMAAGSTLATTQPAGLPGRSTATLPDYGDLLCWGILAAPIPCVGVAVCIALIVLHFLELSAVRKAVAEARLQASDYSKIHPALFLLGLIFCTVICYPLFMHFRNRAGYFKPQPNAVWVAIIAMVLTVGINVALNIWLAALQQSAP